MSARQRHAPATARNRQPILEVLRRVLPASGTVLEVASGSGEHGVFFAAQLPEIAWQPTDQDPEAIESVEAWNSEENVANLRQPLNLDAASPKWPIGSADALVCINMVHISPWAATLGLLDGASRILPVGGPLILYGPYHLAGRPTAASNLDFDASLRARNPEWGLRNAEDVVREANSRQLELNEIVDMPANNVILVFTKIAD